MAGERVDQLGISGRSDARRAGRLRGIEQVESELAQAAERAKRCVTQQDNSALRGAIEGDERRVAAGAAPMHDDGAAVRDPCLGEDLPFETYRAAADPGAKFGKALPLARRAVELTKARYGEDDARYATALNNLASLLEHTNRLSEAEPLYRHAIAIMEKSYGPDHPDVGATVGNLGGLLHTTGRLAEAEVLQRRALAITRKSLGPNHPDVATRLNNLALLLKDTSRLSEAEPLLRRALAINEKGLPRDDPKIAAELNNLAELLEDTNRPAEAEPLYRRALANSAAAYLPSKNGRLYVAYRGSADWASDVRICGRQTLC